MVEKLFMDLVVLERPWKTPSLKIFSFLWKGEIGRNLLYSSSKWRWKIFFEKKLSGWKIIHESGSFWKNLKNTISNNIPLSSLDVRKYNTIKYLDLTLRWCFRKYFYKIDLKSLRVLSQMLFPKFLLKHKKVLINVFFCNRCLRPWSTLF